MSSNASIMSTQESMMDKLLIFYSNSKNLDILKKLINDEEKEKTKVKTPKKIKTQTEESEIKTKKQPKMSLRLINWFCTNYSKQYNVSYYIMKRGKKELFNVYTEYKRISGSESKEFFDPFRRGEKNKKLITIEYKENGEIKNLKTTTAQLNFFRWIITNNILKYIENNLKEIYEDQLKRGSNKKNILENGKVKKRQISENLNSKLTCIDKNKINEDKLIT